jgi:hypothetical protein
VIDQLLPIAAIDHEDLAVKGTLALIGLLVAVIGFFLRVLFEDHREVKRRVEAAEHAMVEVGKDNATIVARLDGIASDMSTVRSRNERNDNLLLGVQRDTSGIIASLSEFKQLLHNQENRLYDISSRLARLEGDEKHQ